MKNKQELNEIRDLIATGKVNKAFEELKKFSEGMDDKELRNAILLNCFSYHKNYNDQLLNLNNDVVGLNRAVLKTLEFLDEIEERLNIPKDQKGLSRKGALEVIAPNELPINVEKKIDIVVEKYFSDVIIDRGDLYTSLSKSGITLNHLDQALKEVKENFDFFKTQFSYPGGKSGITLSNFTAYAIDAIFVPENEWTGDVYRKTITREFRDLLKNNNK